MKEDAMENRWLGGLLGLAGGVAGLIAMKYGMKLAGAIGLESKASAAPPPSPARPYEAATAGASGAEPRAKKSISVVGVQHEPGETAPAAAGRVVYEKLRHRRPDAATRERLGTGVHLGYGLLMAAGYGALRAGRPGLDVLGGLAFAVGLFALGDELAVPLLGLADAPGETPVRDHGKYLVAHVAYGVATAATTQGLAHAIEAVRR
jgi:hypothetical protein